MTNLKERAFAAYLGSEVQYEDSPNRHTGTLEGYDYRYGFMLSTQNPIVPFKFCNPEYCKLLLKPLSSISDEDAIEVAKLALFDNPFISERGQQSIIIKDQFGRQLILYYTASNPRIYDRSGFEVIEYSLTIFDYLRSRSYNLPFMGVNLIKENIAIIKNESI